MSEALRYEELLMRIKALEARVAELELKDGSALSEADALKQWEAFLTSAPVPTITRAWREFETGDLHAAAIGLSDAAKDKLRQSMSRNAWLMLEEELTAPGQELMAHSARVRILGLLRQLEAMGDVGVEAKA